MFSSNSNWEWIDSWGINLSDVANSYWLRKKVVFEDGEIWISRSRGFIGVEATYFWCGQPQFRRFSSYGLRGESWFCCLYRQELAHSAVPCLFCFRFMSDFHFYFHFLKNNLYPFYFYISKNKIKILFYFNFFYIILMCWYQN
jgi:hypothetical protein